MGWEWGGMGNGGNGGQPDPRDLFALRTKIAQIRPSPIPPHSPRSNQPPGVPIGHTVVQDDGLTDRSGLRPVPETHRLIDQRQPRRMDHLPTEKRRIRFTGNRRQ
jgi:hypothetical protein